MDGVVGVRGLSKDALLIQRSVFAAEFDWLQGRRNASELMIDRIFKSAEHPEFHRHLDVLHELWIIEARDWALTARVDEAKRQWIARP